MGRSKSPAQGPTTHCPCFRRVGRAPKLLSRYRFLPCAAGSTVRKYRFAWEFANLFPKLVRRKLRYAVTILVTP